MKLKTHKFIVKVVTTDSRPVAEYAILKAFVMRQPDGKKFYVNKQKS